MKKVFSSTQEVCDIWARQEQDEARTGSNTSFRRDTLYSYRTAIGRIVTRADGTKIALVSSASYSSGTSKVQGEAMAAAAKAGIPAYRAAELTGDHVQTNLSRYRALIALQVEKIGQARDRWNAADYRREALRLIGEAMMFARHFDSEFDGLGFPNPIGVYHKQEKGPKPCPNP